MTERDPLFLGTGFAYDPAETRLMFSALTGSPRSTYTPSNQPGIPGHGRVGLGDLAVTEDDTVGMRVKVSAGVAMVAGSEANQQGVYVVENDAPKVVNLAASDATNRRNDLIVARIRDADFSGVDRSFSIEVVQGTNYAGGHNNANDPTVPANSLVLARVRVASGVGSITDAAIDPITNYATLLSAVRLWDRVVLESSGSFVKGNYPWARRVLVKIMGGGGGGSGAPATGSSQGSFGDGGGEGGYSERWFDVDELEASVTVTIGAGGATNTTTGGSDGGTTSFGSHMSATGGQGGPIRAATTGNRVLGSAATRSGGMGSGGDLNLRGAPGLAGASVDQGSAVGVRGGTGGGGRYGAAGPASFGGSQPQASEGYGVGGTGAANNQSNSATPGRPGTPGVCIVEVYA